jgi:hypothetical protein
MTISIINRKTAPKQPQKGCKRIYCGRGSALGNPFIIGVDGDRDQVCRLYNTYFQVKVDMNDQYVMNQLDEILKASDQSDVELECYCAPQRCHCETIKAYCDNINSLEDQAKNGRFQ